MRSAVALLVDVPVGAGVAMDEHPWRSFGSIPLWHPSAPEAASTTALVDAAVIGAVNRVASEPAVPATLAQVLALLPVERPAPPP